MIVMGKKKKVSDKPIGCYKIVLCDTRLDEYKTPYREYA